MDFNSLFKSLVETQGIWAALFVLLIWWVVRENRERELRTAAEAKERESVLMEFVKTVGPIMQNCCDLVESSIAIETRIEKKVDSCDTRRG